MNFTNEINNMMTIGDLLYFYKYSKTEYKKYIKKVQLSLKFLTDKNRPDFFKISKEIKDIINKFEYFEENEKIIVLNIFKNIINIIDLEAKKLNYDELTILANISEDIKNLLYKYQDIVIKEDEMINETNLIKEVFRKVNSFNPEIDSRQNFITENKDISKYITNTITPDYEKIFNKLNEIIENIYLEYEKYEDSLIYYKIANIFNDFYKFDNKEIEDKCLEVCIKIIEKFDSISSTDKDCKFLIKMAIRTKVFILYSRNLYLQCYKLCDKAIINDENKNLFDIDNNRIIRIKNFCKKKLQKNIKSEPVKRKKINLRNIDLEKYRMKQIHIKFIIILISGIIALIFSIYFSPKSESMYCNENYNCTIEHNFIGNIRHITNLQLAPYSIMTYKTKYIKIIQMYI